jgi:hypothetical protein
MQLHFSQGVSLTFALGASLLLAPAAFSQSAQASTSTSTTTSSPVAYVYITYQPTSDSAPVIRGYTADAQGQLTPIPGGPWPGIAQATTGSYFFASNLAGTDVYSYSVAANGALTQVATYRIANRAPTGCENQEYFGNFILDHTGADLYASGSVTPQESTSDCPANNVTQSYHISKESGLLTYRGMITNPYAGIPETFSSNNLYAFGPQGSTITMFTRETSESGGALDYSITTPAEPVGAGSESYFTGPVAADPTSHLAVVEEPSDTGYNTILESYTIESNGHLKTTSTVDNSATTSSPNVFALRMSYTGNLLAVADDYGVRVYHFNGADPITAYTPNLTNDLSTSMDWDDANHLYISGLDKLYVFTVTPTGYSQAPGSPYSIPYNGNIVVRAVPQ